MTSADYQLFMQNDDIYREIGHGRWKKCPFRIGYCHDNRS